MPPYEDCCAPEPQPINQQVAQEMDIRAKEAHGRADRLQAEADSWRAVGVACNRARTSLIGDEQPKTCPPSPEGW